MVSYSVLTSFSPLSGDSPSTLHSGKCTVEAVKQANMMQKMFISE